MLDSFGDLIALLVRGAVIVIAGLAVTVIVLAVLILAGVLRRTGDTGG